MNKPHVYAQTWEKRGLPEIKILYRWKIFAVDLASPLPHPVTCLLKTTAAPFLHAEAGPRVEASIVLFLGWQGFPSTELGRNQSW